MKNTDLVKKTFLATLTVVITLSVFVVFFKSSTIFLSALVGVGVSSLIAPVITQFEKKYKIPRFLGAILFLIVIFLVFLLVFFAAGSVLFDQFESFEKNFPGVVTKWQEKLNAFTNDYPKVKGLFKSQSQASGLTKSILSYLAFTVSGLFSAITGVILASVIALFTSVNSRKYYKTILEVVPSKYKDSVKERMLLSSSTLRKWFVAQITDMVLVALITGLALWMYGVKYWALFSLMTGVLSIVPFLGIMLVVCFAGAVVLAVQPDKFVGLVFIFILTQQLEGNLILPKLMSKQVHVPAAPLIFFMTLAGVWFGLLGVLVIPPLLAILVAQYRFGRS